MAGSNPAWAVQGENPRRCRSMEVKRVSASDSIGVKIVLEKEEVEPFWAWFRGSLKESTLETPPEIREFWARMTETLEP